MYVWMCFGGLWMRTRDDKIVGSFLGMTEMPVAIVASLPNLCEKTSEVTARQTTSFRLLYQYHWHVKDNTPRDARWYIRCQNETMIYRIPLLSAKQTKKPIALAILLCYEIRDNVVIRCMKYKFRFCNEIHPNFAMPILYDREYEGSHQNKYTISLCELWHMTHWHVHISVIK